VRELCSACTQAQRRAGASLGARDLGTLLAAGDAVRGGGELFNDW
jgi:hypothetical protein